MIDLEHFRGKRCLLLLGPVGPFFYRFSKDLKKYAEKVYKINFSGGDFLFYPKEAYTYRGNEKDWPKFFKNFCEEHKVDTIFMLNDCKFVHRLIKDYLKNKEREIEIWVFEQGYIRPNYITLEPYGVNGNSKIFKNPEFFKSYKRIYRELPEIPISGAYKYWYFYSFLYFLSYLILRPLFPASKLSYAGIFKAGIAYVLNFIKKIFYDITQSFKIHKILKDLKDKYYFVPLQVFNDSQIRFFSPYKDIKDFIEEVLISFAKYGLNDTYLIFKHHPLDIGFRCYRKLIDEISKELKIRERIFYFKTGDIKAFIENSLGVITVNSTVGVTALLMGKPVKVMGEAIYDIDGLTFKGKLDEFWKESLSFKVDEEILKGFINYLKDNILINGSFYKRIKCKNNAGIIYNPSYYPNE